MPGVGKGLGTVFIFVLAERLYTRFPSVIFFYAIIQECMYVYGNMEEEEKTQIMDIVQRSIGLQPKESRPDW